MKSRKLLVSAATAYLLVGASGAAMAVDCPTGVITLTTVDEIVINAQPCFINEVVVAGRVEVTNSPELTMINVEAGGPVTIRGGGPTIGANANIVGVDTFTGDLTVNGNTSAIVAGNIVQQGNLTVENNAGAVVQRNAVRGNITCTNNAEVDAFGNRAGGEDNCQNE